MNHLLQSKIGEIENEIYNNLDEIKYHSKFPMEIKSKGLGINMSDISAANFE